MIRNNYLYHYPNDKNVEKAFEAIPEDETWEWYLSYANKNSMYLSAEMVLGAGMMNVTGKENPAEAFGEVMAKTMELSNAIPSFLMPLTKVICVKYLGADVLNSRSHTNIEGAPNLGTFWLPFYAHTDQDELGGS
jgi:hypothetical protein